MPFSDFAAPGGVFVLMLGLVPLARKLARRLGYMDAPGGRKQHEKAVPPIGGLVMFPVFMIAVVLCAGSDLFFFLPFLVALFLIVAVGAYDDLVDMNAWVKFAAQFLAACLLVFWGGAHVHQLGHLVSPEAYFGLGLGWIPFSLLAVMLLINAINMMDGIDGLAGGMSFLAGVWLFIAALLAGYSAQALALSLLLAVLAGFLVYNMRNPWRRGASIFLGDAGSMGLGLTLAWFAIQLSQGEDKAALPPISVAWILALPVADAFGLFIARLKRGRHPFSADRGHFHHHFVSAGYSAGEAAVAILCIGLFYGAFGYLGPVLFGLPEYVLTIGFFVVLAGHTCIALRPAGFTAFLSRLRACG